MLQSLLHGTMPSLRYHTLIYFTLQAENDLRKQWLALDLVYYIVHDTELTQRYSIQGVSLSKRSSLLCIHLE